MKDYSNYGAVDFVQDDQFLKWVKYASLYPEIDRFWVTWLEENPGKSEEVEEARRMIFALLEEGAASHISSRQDEVLSRLRKSMASETPTKKLLVSKGVSLIAAAVLALIVASVFYLVPVRISNETVSDAGGKSKFIKEINNGDSPKTILLADGSSILLFPYSELQYPKAFEQNMREVILTGEAFFDISKDINKPFVVYTDKVLTRVLGTSFSIRAFSGEDDILVKVRTGKVSVVARTSDNGHDNNLDSRNPDGVVLTPNQQVIYIKKESKFKKALVDEPVILKESGEFTFTDTPVRDVFTRIEDAYGVDIVFDEELMRDCLLNGSLEDMALYDKLRVICKSVNAQYEVVDSHIVINGHGCKEK